LEFEMNWLYPVCAYLIGSFPSGKLVARAYGIDITKAGSGNVGATNLARSVGKQAGIITLLLDVVKGFITPLAAHQLGAPMDVTLATGVAVVAGHCFSIPGLLRGGKGVATSLGAFLFIGAVPTLIGLGLFSAIVKKTRLVSLASILGVGCTPFAAALLGMPWSTVSAFAAVSMVVTIRHSQNIGRLLRGTETKFAAAKSGASPLASESTR
jgi:acyl phosphate:glycerol-3-phosphate acyltransferase